MSNSTYFDLKQSFKFYGAFHHNRINKVIHIICVPLIFITSIELLARVAPSWSVLAIFLFYLLSFVLMDVRAGLAYAPVMILFWYLASTVFANHPSLSLGIFVVAWLAQFAGHGFFEKRAPALLSNLPQALHAAVFFVWLEVIFALSFRNDLRKQLEAAVKQEMKTRGF
jgi:uncharacterized membrane protein YGL010W